VDGIARQLHAPCLDRRQCDGKSQSRGPRLADAR
jgi:hypothetical protein